MASSESYDAYSANLREDSAQKAKDELSEKPDENRPQLKQFTDWIHQQKKWLTAPVDPVFLMSFLRVRKSSQLLARETLVNFLTTREKETQYFANSDVDDPKVMACLKCGFFLPMPRPDKHGRQVCFIRPALLDPSGEQYKMPDASKTVFMIMDYLLRDENVQVNGVVVVLDYSNVTRQHQAFAGDHRKKLFKILNKTYPLRIKSILIYNVGAFMEIVLGILKAVLPDKIQKRIEAASDMVTIYTKLGQSCLPLDYLPDDYKGESVGMYEELSKNLITELQKPESKDWIKQLSCGQYKVDSKTMPPRNELFQEAFRKLNVD